MTNTDEFVTSMLRHAEKIHKALAIRDKDNDHSDMKLEWISKELVLAADKFYANLETPNSINPPVPMEVKRSIVLAADSLDTARERLNALQFCGMGSDQYWGFYIGSMFVGIEPDGYMHT